MTLYERYIDGQFKQVYEDISTLGQDAFLPEHLFDIEKVLRETFQRVAYNLDVIYAELKNIQYSFKTKFEYNSQCPLVKPLPNTEALLIQLENIVRPFGFVPLSLKMFYSVVGACNLSWDYETNGYPIWLLADPLQIFSLDDVVAEMADENYINDQRAYYKEDGFVAIQLSADYFHKDNISGGQSYSLKVTSKRSVDAEWLDEEHGTTFIDYLRICFDNCGFSRIAHIENNNDYRAFLRKVKPMLKPI